MTVKLYKIDNILYELANSLLPPRPPTVEEEAPVAEALITPMGKDLVALFMRLGYTPYQAEHLYRALFTHYWYDYGIRETMHINELIYYWQKSYLAPAWKSAADAPPPLLPPAWIATALVVGIMVVIVILVAPEFEKEIKWTPPCRLYIGTYAQDVWFMTNVGVDTMGYPVYRRIWFYDNVLQGHTYEYIAPPVVTDRLHFWGSMIFGCWILPWFRQYRVIHMDTTFIGFLTHTSGEYYRHRKRFGDPFVGPDPFVLPREDWCMNVSPCGKIVLPPGAI